MVMLALADAKSLKKLRCGERRTEMKSQNYQYTVEIDQSGKVTVGRPGQSLWTSHRGGHCDKPCKLSMKCDDNSLILIDYRRILFSTKETETLVLEMTGNNWASNGYAIIQNDGDFVIFDGNGKAMWRSDTAGGIQGYGHVHSYNGEYFMKQKSST